MIDPLRTLVTMIWLVATPSKPATSDRKLYSKVDRVLEPAVPAKVAKSPFNVSDATVTAGAVHHQLAAQHVPRRCGPASGR